MNTYLNYGKKYFVVDGKASKIPDAMMLVDIW